jgi:hypothetical protein
MLVEALRGFVFCVNQHREHAQLHSCRTEDHITQKNTAESFVLVVLANGEPIQERGGHNRIAG